MSDLTPEDKAKKAALKALQEVRDKKLCAIREEFKKKEKPAKEAYDQVVKPLREIRDKELKAVIEEYKNDRLQEELNRF